MDGYRVIRTEEAQQFSPAAGVGKVYRVHFMVGESGPFTEEFKPADFIPSKVEERLAAVAKTVSALEPGER